MYLLDTVVITELISVQPDAGLVEWINGAAETELHLSVITCADIERAIERHRPANARFADDLANWLDVTLRIYGDRVLPMTVPIARRWGRLAAAVGTRSIDLAIAATALEHRLTLVTRNIFDFAPAGVPTLNPFSGPAPLGP